MYPRQLMASVAIALCLLVLIVRLVQRGRLDIAYCWLWLGIGAGALVIVLRDDVLSGLTRLIGAVAPTTTVFLLGFVMVLLMCLQFSLVISAHRRQIKRLTQRLAILEHDRMSGAAKRPEPGGQTTP
jgi:hypothetical protein